MGCNDVGGADGRLRDSVGAHGGRLGDGVGRGRLRESVGRGRLGEGVGRGRLLHHSLHYLHRGRYLFDHRGRLGCFLHHYGLFYRGGAARRRFFAAAPPTASTDRLGGAHMRRRHVHRRRHRHRMMYRQGHRFHRWVMNRYGEGGIAGRHGSGVGRAKRPGEHAGLRNRYTILEDNRGEHLPKVQQLGVI